MKVCYYIFSLLYRSLCHINSWFYRKRILIPEQAPLPVISIGNISFGGTEKTPLAMNLLSFLLHQNYKPALITRGYKGKWEKDSAVLSDGRKLYGTWKDSGDEPYMVARNIPRAGILIGKNRLNSCCKAKNMGFSIAVLDDGFQHRKLRRDVDIVLFDAKEKIALRESFSALKRCHILLLKETTNPEARTKINARFPDIECFDYKAISLGFYSIDGRKLSSSEALGGKKCLAFSGIARPQRFACLLKKEGIQLIDFICFPDHYPYPPSSLKKIQSRFKSSRADAVITTEKDAVKFQGKEYFNTIPLYYLKIDLEIESEFYDRVLSILAEEK